MAKTNPIGVRFNKELLDAFKDSGIEVTPQKALSIYEAEFKKSLHKNLTDIGGEVKIPPTETILDILQKNVLEIVKEVIKEEPKNNEIQKEIDQIEEKLRMPSKYITSEQRKRLEGMKKELQKQL